MKSSVLFAATLMAMGSNALAKEVNFTLSGNVAAELKGYLEEGQYPQQDYKTNLSLSAEPELYWEWQDGDSSFTFKPFVRWDQRDSERTHSDIRELLWVHVGDGWESRVGIGKVFWGVTEFQHLVDIINQTDSVESFDGEEKLGQPMISLSLVRDWGTLDGYLLPGFRERTFAGYKGRLRGPRLVDTKHPRYESGADEHHLDLALRWSHSIDIFDIGAYWFKGTNREPVLLPKSNGRLTPYYEQIDRLGIDAQATLDAWLLKLEVIIQDNNQQRYSAIQSGFEYTYYGVNETAADVGLLVEYAWDERGKSASSGMQNDITLGARLTMNDTDSTELLVGVGYDLDFNDKSLVIEGNMRVGDSTKMIIDGRFFSSNALSSSSWSLRKDSYIQLTIEHYF